MERKGHIKEDRKGRNAAGSKTDTWDCLQEGRKTRTLKGEKNQTLTPGTSAARKINSHYIWLRKLQGDNFMSS